MTCKVRSIHFILFSSIVFQLFSQSFAQSYTAKTYREVDGLPSNNVFAINQFNNGKLLVVTKNGLCSYDGSNWQTFDHSLKLPLSLHTKIKKDESGKIWLAGYRNQILALGYFEGESWVEHSIPFKEDKPISQNRLAMDLFKKEDGSYSLILGLEQNIFLFDSKSSAWQPVDLPASNSTYEIYDVKFFKGKIYVLTDNGLWVENKLGEFKKSTFEFPSDFLVRMEVDEKNNNFFLLGRNWVGEVNNGKYQTLVANFESVFTFQVSSSHLYLSDNNQLFFGINSMIYYLNKNNKDYEAINVLGQMEAFWHNNIFIDREGNMWLSSNRGLGMISNLSLKFYNHSHGLIEDEVSGVIEVSDNRFLIGGNFSLVLKGEDDCKVLFNKHKSEQVIYRFSNFKLHKNTTYFSGYQKGIGILTENEEIKWIAPLPIKNRPINGFYFIGDSLMVLSDNSIFYWNNSNYDLQKKYSSFIRRVVILKSGEIWLLTTSGIHIISGLKKGKFISGKTSNLNNITDVLEFNNRVIVGTYDGLAEILNDSIVPFAFEGEPINRPVFDLLKDLDNSIWVGTDYGVYVVKENEKTLHLTHGNGLIGNEINRTTMFKNSKGEIMIGTVEGLAVYSVSEVPSAIEKPIPTIYSIKSSKKKNLSLTANNTLKPNENGLEIEFGGISFSSNNRLKFRHRLHGFETEWNSQISEKKTMINYVNLLGGEYTFELQVKDGEGNWSEIARSSTIVILKPFYKQVWFFALIGIGVILLFFFIYQFVIQKKLIRQKTLLEQQHETITKSIRYAKRIQESILPSKKIIDELFNENFIINKPKDIIAGDFYWFSKRHDKVFFAVADCTGHGVPGSIVSVVCSNALNYVVNELGYLSTAEILNRVRYIVVETFKNENFDITDGMDISFCILNTESQLLQFSGAHHSLIRITEKGSDQAEYDVEKDNKVLIEYKGDNQPIGQFNFNKPFTEKFVPLNKGDILYLSSDGYYDQFGGPNGKKMLKNHYKDKLMEISNLTLTDQKISLENYFEDWKQGNMQIDDVCLIGVKI